MGVLDGLSGHDGGGLLSGLPSWWQYQTPEAAPQVGLRLRPRTAAGPTDPAMSVASAGAPSADPAAAQASLQAPLSGFFNRLADGLQSVAHGGSLAGAVRGQYDDSASKQAQMQNFTAKALLARGIDPQAVNAAVQPGNGELLKNLIAQAYGPQLAQSLGSGYTKLSPRQSIIHRGATITRPR